MNTILKNTVICITGASSGIGAACAFKFAEQGAKLLLIARRIEKLNEVKNAILLVYPDTHILTQQCDIRHQNEVSLLFESLSDDWKDINVLINNAGLSRGLEKIQDGILQNWEEMIDTNIKGLLYVTRCIAPKMVERKTGMIINIASIAGREVYPGGNVYCATKAAARTLSAATRVDMNGTGIRVVNIDPGMVETEFSLVRFHGDSQKASSVYNGFIPLTGEDIADTVVFCATRPPHITIADILILPTAQASTTLVHKEL
jgi:serine 3-dehydrogenase